MSKVDANGQRALRSSFSLKMDRLECRTDVTVRKSLVQFVRRKSPKK
jgi:hypothetical protein